MENNNNQILNSFSDPFYKFNEEINPIFSPLPSTFFTSNVEEKKSIKTEKSYVFCKTDCKNICKAMNKWINERKVFASVEIFLESIRKKYLPNCEIECLHQHLKECNTKIKCHLVLKQSIKKLVVQPLPTLPTKDCSKINSNQGNNDQWKKGECESIEIHVDYMKSNGIKVPYLNNFIAELYNNRILVRPFLSIVEHLEGKGGCKFCVQLLPSVVMKIPYY